MTIRSKVVCEMTNDDPLSVRIDTFLWAIKPISRDPLHLPLPMPLRLIACLIFTQATLPG
jgi:hypothetical protein